MTDNSRNNQPEESLAPSLADEIKAARQEAKREKLARRKIGISGSIASAFLESKLTPLLVVAALLIGGLALLITPREEEPQIKVPMVDVTVGFPGATPLEVERRVITPLEKILYEIENVEYIYSTSRPSGGMVVVRFYVGTDPDQAVTRIHAKLQAAADQMPQGATPPLVKLRTIDDVPSVAYTLWSTQLSSTELRKVAEELKSEFTKHPRVSQVNIIGGQRRVVRVTFDRDRLAAYQASILQAYGALAGANWRLPAGELTADNEVLDVHVGGLLRDVEDVQNTLVGVYNGRPVYLRDVATIEDGPEEPDQYVWMGSGPAAQEKQIAVAGIDATAVTISIAKKPGTNAIDMVSELDQRLEMLKRTVVPADVELTKTRDYGFTAKEKSDELIFHVLLATISVVLLMWLMLGRREATVVLVAVPVTLALTLAASYFFGYTLNRVTLFALIFSIGILVDDAIVVVENIHRHYQLRWTTARHATVFGVDEVGNPTILATLTVIAALLPLAFVSGLMGPYMRPIPVNASAAMFFSLLVAFIISPWLTYRLFGKLHASTAHQHYDETAEEGKLHRLYSRIMQPLLDSPKRRYLALGGVVVLLLLSMLLLPARAVVVKMMPYDNKSELQVVIDAPEDYSLERTNAAARDLASVFTNIPEVTDYQVYVGTSAPFNFNGLVRYYFLRSGANVADIQVNLINKHKRDEASHDIAKAVRTKLLPIATRHGVNIKVSEVPPGPPVLSTMVAEVYGPELAGRIAVAQQVKQIFATTDGIADVDWLVEDAAPRAELVIDHERAARAGIPADQIARTVAIAVSGTDAGLLHDDRARAPVPIVFQLDRNQRSRLEDLLTLRIADANGRLIPLGELVSVQHRAREPFIYHKNLQPVTYVIGEVAGTEESPVYGILNMGERLNTVNTPTGRPLAVMSTHLPQNSQEYALKWDGEWHITYEVFRDMGAAFAVVVLLIYVLVVGWFGSFITPLIIMAPIPLTLIGILPGHGMLGTFFTATSMIGFIALSGIVVRNSILLVDFINQELRAGETLESAVLKAGAVRFRPIVLTALALVVGASVIYLDPIFQGLAVSLIFGVVASTALTLVVIPLLYYMYLKVAGTSQVAGVQDQEGA
ncbi:efflux RND transporter permease subunit [candidate division KSB1 bacterium]|nr:efflux RND transporter permease subunit [candidate division KSB1 bacterium]